MIQGRLVIWLGERYSRDDEILWKKEVLFRVQQWRAEVLGCPVPTSFLDAGGRANPCIFCPEENLHFPNKINFSEKIFYSRLKKFLLTFFFFFSHLP